MGLNQSQRLFNPAAGRRSNGFGQLIGVKPLRLVDFTNRGGLSLFPAFDAVIEDVIAAMARMIIVNGQQARARGRHNPHLFDQFADHRRLGRLAAIDAAARQVPALDIGVLDQQHPPRLIRDQPTNAQGHTPL